MKADTIGALLRALATAARMPDVFGGHDGPAKIAPILDTLASISEVPAGLEKERAALIATVDSWVKENRGPTLEELEAFKATRDELDKRAQAALASLPPKGTKAAPLLVAALFGVLWVTGFVQGAFAQTPPPQTGTLVVNWVNPTSYTDGTALPSSELVGNRVAWGTCAGTAFTKAGEHKLAKTTTDTITGLTLGGTYCVQVFATAQKAGGQPVESDPASITTLTFPPPVVVTPKPGSPTTVTVTCSINGQVITCTGTLK